ncbi:MAG: hypothetical protein U0946_05450 [Patescibacteria group bacterium]|nr:hypothetical protein [Patescibacteria group bacterium]
MMVMIAEVKTGGVEVVIAGQANVERQAGRGAAFLSLLHFSKKEDAEIFIRLIESQKRVALNYYLSSCLFGKWPINIHSSKEPFSPTKPFLVRKLENPLKFSFCELNWENAKVPVGNTAAVIEDNRPDWLKALEPSSNVPEVEAAVTGEAEEVESQAVEAVAAMGEKFAKGEKTVAVKFGKKVLQNVVEATVDRIIETAGGTIRPKVTIESFNVNNGVQIKANIAAAGKTIPVELTLGPDLNYINHTVGNIPTIPLVFNKQKRDALLAEITRRLREVRQEIFQTISDQMPNNVRLERVDDPRIEGEEMTAEFQGKLSNDSGKLSF